MLASPSNSIPLGSEFRDQQPSTALSRLSAVDWMLILFLCVFLFAVSAYRSRTRLFWADELISHQIFSDPSFLHMLRAWYRGADSGGLTYYLLCPLWLRLFGLSELSLRLFSTAGMSAALALLWIALRRYVSTPLTAAAIGVTFFTPPAMLWQEVNGRFYGLYFAFAALAALCFLLLTDHERPSRSLLALSLLANAGLVASHIFGLLFSFSFVVGTWAADRIRHRTRWPVYLVPAAGWLLVLLSLPSLRASASVVKTVFWTSKPGIADLLFSVAASGRVAAIVLVMALGAGFLRRLLGWFLPAQRLRALVLPLAPTALIGSLLLTDLFFFGKSQTGLSIYSDRYLLPISIATAFLVAGALALLLPARRNLLVPGLPSVLLATLALVPCCWYAVNRQPNAVLYPTSAYLAELRHLWRPGVPAVAGLPVFPFLETYAPDHPTLFLTNWAYDDNPGHPSDYSGERLMENWKRAGYQTDNILPCAEIFTRFRHLDLLVDTHLAPWFSDRVLPDPHLRVMHAGTIRNWIWIDLWTVDRISPGPPPC